MERLCGKAVTEAQLRDLYQRKARAIARRPGFGAGSGRTRVTLRSDAGLRCEAEADPGGTSQLIDATSADGGDGSAPSPADLLRASIGACVAMGCRIWAARREVSLDAVVVEITAEYDDRGALGLSAEAPVGWRRLIVAVALTSEALEVDLREVLALALRHSPMLANLAPAIVQVHGFSVVRPSR